MAMKWNELRRGYSDRLSEIRKRTPQELLGVSTVPSKQELKEAYFRLIKTYHPDRADPFMARYNEEMTKLINEAYEKLRERMC